MKRRTPLVLAVLSLLVALLLTTGCTTVVAAPGGAGLNAVTASGSGTVHAAPDQADMTFGVSSSDSNAKSALQSASKAAERISAALEKAGIDKKDIQTQNVSVYPNYANNSSKPTITGYTASISVRASVRDIGTLGDVINAANAAGADSIDGPSFSIADESGLHGQAIDKAVADAHTRAEAMAKAAGKSVGAVISISESSVTATPGPMYDAARATKAGSVPIALGELDVTAEVTVVYELK